ncbi:MAG: cellulase family glycosylhydrolase [Acidimicrobiales bacterium]|nr:cellulase family glycosylhydrolase [Acidimicrobiales bacterium]
MVNFLTVRRGVFGMLLLVAAALGACSSNTNSSPATAPAPSLGFLHVGNPDGNGVDQLVDSGGRNVTLRGVALSGFEDQAYQGSTGTTPHYPTDPNSYNGVCPNNDGKAPDPPLCEVQASLPWDQQSSAYSSQNDLAQVRADGFNVVRLTVNWSELEPNQGQYSTQFLDRIAQVVSWAGQQGVSVILDMHEDGYSRFLNMPADKNAKKISAPSGCTPSNGQDGAPAWAVFTGGEPSCSLLGQNQLNPAMAQALTNFWQNMKVPGPQGASPGPGLEDHFIGALSFMAKRFVNNPTVIGYEVLNEPLPPGSGSIPVDNLFTFSSQMLFPFYQRAIEAITGVRDGKPTCAANAPSGSPQLEGGPSSCAYPDQNVHTKQLIFVEPTGYRNQLEFGPQMSYDPSTPDNLPPPLSSYQNLVYAPHIYTHVFSLDTIASHSTSPGPPALNSVSTFPTSVTGPPNGPGTTYPPSYLFGYATALSEAKALRAALVVTEYGSSPGDDATILSGMVRAQYDAGVSAIFWTWKENCGSASSQCGGGWGIYNSPASSTDGTLSQNGTLRTNRLAIVTGPIMEAVDGSVVSQGYDPTTGDYSAEINVTKSAPVGNLGQETEVYIPQSGAKDHVVVKVISTAATVDRTLNIPGGGRIVYIASLKSGRYLVSVISPSGAANSTQLDYRVQLQATIPVSPVSEPVARTVITDYVSALASSSSPADKTAATIFNTLEGIILGTPSSDPNGPMQPIPTTGKLG